MIQGIVKWFSAEKGYGFIESGGKDYFLHFKEIQAAGFKSVNEGDIVCFEPDTSSKGLVAKSVSLKQD
jgi:CspA family cold shock protein